MLVSFCLFKKGSCRQTQTVVVKATPASSWIIPHFSLILSVQKFRDCSTYMMRACTYREAPPCGQCAEIIHNSC